MSAFMDNYRYYQDRGRCPQCHGKRLVTPGYKSCEVCRERGKKRYAERCEKLRKAGVCIRCGKPKAEDRTLCPDCLKYKTKYSIKQSHDRYYSLLEAGKCVRCGVRYAEAGHSNCRKCLERHKAEIKRYDPDNAKKNARRQARREAGLCIDCGKPALEGSSRCKKCTEARRDSARKYSILKAIDRQAEKARRNNK